MLTRTGNKQIKFHMVTIEDLVPEDHFVHKLDWVVYFSFIYEEVSGYYCENNGRPYANPVILIKYLPIHEGLEGKTYPSTDVSYRKHVFTLNGERVEGVFPAFNSIFDTCLPGELRKLLKKANAATPPQYNFMLGTVKKY